MREPLTALPSDLDSIPDRPAVFLLWAGQGAPYLARTSLLRRRLKRLISNRQRLSSVLNLSGIVERIEYWLTGSKLESALIHLDLAKRHFPDDVSRVTRLKPPVFLRLTVDNAFPRTMLTTRLGRGFYYGPFAGRGAAERFQNEMLDLFQLRRCEENLAPAPDHPGCIYGEMNKCLRPCQQVVSIEEYRGEATRVEQFLRTDGASLRESAETARDQASAAMQFEEAEHMHQRLTRIEGVQDSAGDLARALDRLAGVAIVPSAKPESVDLVFFAAGRWLAPRAFSFSEDATFLENASMDRRLREQCAGISPRLSPDIPDTPDLEHLAILVRWQGSSWRDGEWIGFDSFEKIPYRKIVNAVARVAARG
jgi:excinuclease UvrABC nuclease subunit